MRWALGGGWGVGTGDAVDPCRLAAVCVGGRARGGVVSEGGGGPRGWGLWAEGWPTRQSHLKGGGGLAWVHVALVQGEPPTLGGWRLATGMMGRRVAVGERGRGGGGRIDFGGGRATLDGQPFLWWPSPTLAWPRRGTRRRWETPLARSGSRTAGGGVPQLVARGPDAYEGRGEGTVRGLCLFWIGGGWVMAVGVRNWAAWAESVTSTFSATTPTRSLAGASSVRRAGGPRRGCSSRTVSCVLHWPYGAYGGPARTSAGRGEACPTGRQRRPSFAMMAPPRPAAPCLRPVAGPLENEPRHMVSAPLARV